MTDDRTRTIRTGFGRLAVAVAIITTLDDGRPHGCTGMAWAEHATPPLLLTTLRSDGRTRELVGAARQFGIPVLDGCLVSFECAVEDIYPFGGHGIVVGRVAWASAAGEEWPVVHYDGHLWGLREADG